MEKPKTRDEMTAMLQHEGWKLVHSEQFFMSSFEIWENSNNPYQIRLSWPLHGDCNGATTTEIEIGKALHIMGIEAES